MTFPQTSLASRPASHALPILDDFGHNPGELTARIHIPHALPANAPLVVVLHGGAQNAADYDVGSGWSTLADRHGFAVLFPEQRRSNNFNLCFNWYQAGDNRRGSGEAGSIADMVEAVIVRHGVDRRRIFITGFSAGGGMASVMLAAYPDLFAGGAVIGGFAYGCAIGLSAALVRMLGHGGPNATDLAALIRAASDHRGPWPTMSVWHGEIDYTVHRSNGVMTGEQWRLIHGVDSSTLESDRVDGHMRQTWRNGEGRAVVEEYMIAGMGHGTPTRASGEGGCGAVGPYMLDVRISAASRIADFWGLAALF